MSDTALHINFQDFDRIDDSIWAHMEQADTPLYDGKASLDDILNMTALERARMTAFSYRMEDNVYFSDNGNTINIPLTFYVFPSTLDLDYSLTIQDPGRLSSRTMYTPTKTQNIVIPMSNKVELPYAISSLSSEWNTPCYDSLGNIVPCPTYSFDKNFLYLDNTIFGVLRGTFGYIGHKYVATLKFQKTVTTLTDPDITKLKGIILNQATTNQISNVECAVICKYIDENGEEQQEKLDLQIPESVLLYLKSCPNDPGSTMIKWPDEKEHCHTTYYYSVCTGDVISVRRAGSCNLFD